MNIFRTLRTRMRLETTRNQDGTLSTIVYNWQGTTVGHINYHSLTGEALEIAARQFRDDHPDLFSDHILVDTAAESQKKNETAYRDGLQPVPGN
jgi:hypothetical protein